MSEKPISEKPSTRPESPTTARELDFDDEPLGESHDSAVTSPVRKPKGVSFQDEQLEVPPPKPPRPMSAQQQAENTLIEAFPGIDSKVIKAVLVASGGRVEPAFNALLGMSDPNYKEDPVPPPQPPRPTAQQRQLEQDELYARQLAEHFQSTAGYEGYGSRSRGDPSLPQQRQQTNLKPDELYDDREHSFFDDDLPVIKENVRKGFIETQQKFNRWISDFRKKLDGEDDGDDMVHPGGSSSAQRQNFGPSHSDQVYGVRKSAERSRRSGDRERYDADPQVLSDDFTALELKDNDVPPPQPPRRPLANPDLFKPTPMAPPTSGMADEGDALYRQPTPVNRQPSPGAGGKTKKWQPLTPVAPNPETEDHDPFSLGDSDEESEVKTKDVRAEDAERLKRSGNVSTTEPAGSEGTGTKDESIRKP